MRTVYRIVDAAGTEVYRGKRSAVLKKAARFMLDDLGVSHKVQRGRYDPKVEDERYIDKGGRWEYVSANVQTFIQGE